MTKLNLNNKQVSQRNTLKNFFKLVSSGKFLEILKVLRRRLINGLRFVRHIILRVWRIVYDQPVLLGARQKKQMIKIMKSRYAQTIGSKPNKQLVIGLVAQDLLTHPRSSTFIRLLSPLANNVDLRLLSADSLDLPSDLDVCVIQRTAINTLAKAEDLVSQIRASGAKLVVDNDDAFDLMDITHPEKNSHNQSSVALNYLLKSADQVWLSTAVLRDSTAKLNTRAIIVPNGLDHKLWRATRPKKLSRRRAKRLQLVYMGTGTHDHDLKLILPALDQVASTYPDSFTLTVIGVASILPERVWLRRLHVRRTLTLYPNFVRWFLRQGPFDVGLAPLVDSKFNDSKSDIKCLDYLAAGILPVVSDVPAYKNPELNDYIIRSKNTTVAWQETLSNLVKDLEETRQVVNRSVAGAQKQLLPSRSSKKVGQQLLDQLSKLRPKT